ncbi:tyrosine-type recombinase/integrase [Candidatus Fermentibacterales bacterium]|nr:tyrosine-type recombinase/integrase [Candidatus Fermentibacterales bacterium]
MADLLQEMRNVLIEAGRSVRTANSYLSHIRRLTRTFGDSVTGLTHAQLESYFNALLEERKSLSYINQAQSAIRFLYTEVLKKADPLPESGLPSRGLPLHGVFTREEISSIIGNTEDIRYRLALMLVYSSGLRVGEAACLLLAGIDRKAMVIHVNSRGGSHVRDTILARSAESTLDQYLRTRSAESPFLFPGRGRKSCISARTIQRAFSESLAAAGVDRHATLGWLRHSFAVHLLEDGVDRKLLQRLLGVSTPSMMTPYVKLAVGRGPLRIMSPMDRFMTR